MAIQKSKTFGNSANSFIHFFVVFKLHRYLLNVSYMADTFLGSGETLRKRHIPCTCPLVTYILLAQNNILEMELLINKDI